MRFARLIPTLLVVSMTALLACDWVPGSKLSWSQTVRTWTPILSGNCLMVGTYFWAVDATMPPYQGKSSIKLNTEFKDQMEFLPQFVDVNYYLNQGLYYQQAYELRKGMGRIDEQQPNFWNFSMGDQIDYEICAGGGDIPIHTEIKLSLGYKFSKQEIGGTEPN